MQPVAPFCEEQFQYLAMGRTHAYAWETLAQQLAMPLETVARVAWTDEKLCNRALTKAERLVTRETITEVAVVLRRDIRNGEPQHRATLANSLTRVLKLQQEFAPPRGNKPTPVMPVPTTPTVAPSVGPALGATMASLLGFFLLVSTLLAGCWHHTEGPVERTGTVSELVALLVWPDEMRWSGHAIPPAPCVVLTPPPWGREHSRQCHDGA